MSQAPQQPNGGGAGQGGAQNPKQLKVEDALEYLDQVKRQFQHSPGIYNRFLEIMKSFKSQDIDTPGVIREVSELFKGHQTLILGFNTFLPPGYRIEVVDQEGTTHISQPGGGTQSFRPRQPVTSDVPTTAPPQYQPNIPQQQPFEHRMPPQQQHLQPQHPQHAPPPNHPPSKMQNQGSPYMAQQPMQHPRPPVQAPQGGTMPRQDMPPHGVQSQMIDHPPGGDSRDNSQAPEFDHAISYVTKIKKRFSNDPTTYRNFLEILHSYQKQQESIKEVLDKVTRLFREHPDLLEDFTYFLPDAVQNQARERLAKAAAASKKAIQDRELAREQDRQQVKDQYEHFADVRTRTAREMERNREFDHEYRMERERHMIGAPPGRSAHAAEEERYRRSQEAMHLKLPPSDQEFFAKVKAAIGSQELWEEFLKCLHLFTHGIFGQKELINLLTNIFGDRNATLLEELQTFINARGGIELGETDVWHSMPTSEIDFSQCELCTPSYRRLPDNYPRQVGSERSPFENEVLNDDLVSVPTGSEDFSFKHMRRNQYEEALFKCEDERYEVDMVIDNNTSAIRVLEPLAEEIEALKHMDGYQWQFRLDRRSLGVIHLKAIARIYGEHGNEVLELLRKNPADAIPIILTRLKEKDKEWRRARTELNKTWKEIQEKNYTKSLDHRSFYFKAADKRAITMKSLTADMKKKIEEGEAEIQAALKPKDSECTEDQKIQTDVPMDGTVSDHADVASEAKKGGPSQVVWKDEKTPIIMPTLHFIYRDTSVHQDVAEVLSYAIEKYGSEGNKDKIAALWRSFLFKFFRFHREWMLPATGNKIPTGPGVLMVGTTCETPLGMGIIEDVSYLSEDGETKESGECPPGDQCQDVRYAVSLPYGLGYFNQDSVKQLVDPCSVLYSVGGYGTGSGSRQAEGGGMINPEAAKHLPGMAGKVKPVQVESLNQSDEHDKEVASTGRLASPSAVLAGAAASLFESSDVVVDAPDEKTEEKMKEALKGTPAPPPDSIVYCSSCEYAFFRLHQMLADRLQRAKELCKEAGGKRERSMLRHIEDRAMDTHKQNEKRAGEEVPGDDFGTEGNQDSEDKEAGSQSKEKKAEELYHHFLTALCALIDGKIDSSKYEDECRSLMGSGSYFLFTMDKLAGACAKQMSAMVTDATAIKLRSLYEYFQARINLITASQSPEEAKKNISDALASYRNNVAAILTTRTDDIYAVQYVEEDPKVVKIAKEKWNLDVNPDECATLSFRLVGKPTYEVSEATLQHLDHDVPTEVSRLVGEGTVLQLRGTIPSDEYAIMQEGDAYEKKAGNSRVLLNRNARVNESRSQTQSQVVNQLTSNVTPVGTLIPQSGTQDVFVAKKEHTSSMPEGRTESNASTSASDTFTSTARSTKTNDEDGDVKMSEEGAHGKTA